jgi:hypothetical protein
MEAIILAIRRHRENQGFFSTEKKARKEGYINLGNALPLISSPSQEFLPTSLSATKYTPAPL